MLAESYKMKLEVETTKLNQIQSQLDQLAAKHEVRNFQKFS